MHGNQGIPKKISALGNKKKKEKVHNAVLLKLT